MRGILLGLLLLGLPRAGLAAPDAEGIVRSEELNFEISMPDSIDWDKLEPKGENKALKAHFKTEYADSDPPAFGEVQLMVVPLKKTSATKGLDFVAKEWASSMEAPVQNRRDLKEGKTTLGGQEAYYRDVKGDYISGLGHITWYVGRMGEYLYVLWILRTYQAIGDEDLEAEIKEVVDSFKYLKIVKVTASKKAKKGGGDPAGPAGQGRKGGKGEPEIDPKQVKRLKISNSHWRFQCVKPEGLFSVDPTKFAQVEKSNNLVAKFQRRKGQTYLLIRVYAQSAKSQRYTIEQLAERNLKFFEKTYKENMRLKPEIDKNYRKFPLAKKAIKMKLVGRRKVPETTFWYLAQCKNDRQYQLQIYISGATGEKDWASQIKDFVKNFKPKKK